MAAVAERMNAAVFNGASVGCAARVAGRCEFQPETQQWILQTVDGAPLPLANTTGMELGANQLVEDDSDSKMQVAPIAVQTAPLQVRASPLGASTDSRLLFRLRACEDCRAAIDQCQDIPSALELRSRSYLYLAWSYLFMCGKFCGLFSRRRTCFEHSDGLGHRVSGTQCGLFLGGLVPSSQLQESGPPLRCVGKPSPPSTIARGNRRPRLPALASIETSLRARQRTAALGALFAVVGLQSMVGLMVGKVLATSGGFAQSPGINLDVFTLLAVSNSCLGHVVAGGLAAVQQGSLPRTSSTSSDPFQGWAR
eukprot:g18249.t1